MQKTLSAIFCLRLYQQMQHRILVLNLELEQQIIALRRTIKVTLLA